MEKSMTKKYAETEFLEKIKLAQAQYTKSMKAIEEKNLTKKKTTK
jgi:hypothetical protein